MSLGADYALRPHLMYVTPLDPASPLLPFCPGKSPLVQGAPWVHLTRHLPCAPSLPCCPSPLLGLSLLWIPSLRGLLSPPSLRETPQGVPSPLHTNGSLWTDGSLKAISPVTPVPPSENVGAVGSLSNCCHCQQS